MSITNVVPLSVRGIHPLLAAHFGGARKFFEMVERPLRPTLRSKVTLGDVTMAVTSDITEATARLTTLTPNGTEYCVTVPLDNLGEKVLVKVNTGQGAVQEVLSLDQLLSQPANDALARIRDVLSQVLRISDAPVKKEKSVVQADQAETAYTAATTTTEESAQDSAEKLCWFTYEPVNEPTVKVRGQLIAKVWSIPVQGRAYVWEVIQCPSGRYVGAKSGTSIWAQESKRSEVKEAHSLDELVAFFGYSPMAKALYEQLGMTDKVTRMID